MTILDIGGGFKGTETQLELVGFSVWLFIVTYRSYVKYHQDQQEMLFLLLFLSSFFYVFGRLTIQS